MGGGWLTTARLQSVSVVAATSGMTRSSLGLKPAIASPALCKERVEQGPVLATGDLQGGGRDPPHPAAPGGPRLQGHQVSLQVHHLPGGCELCARKDHLVTSP